MKMVGIVGVLAAATSASFIEDVPVGLFFRNVTEGTTSVPLNEASKWMQGIVHYRLLPGEFPTEMHYHFDGLAAVASFRFSADGQSLEMSTVKFASPAEQEWDKCFFFGSGTTAHEGLRPCFKNPAVNLLPIEDQLWLTIDTFAWGRVDPTTLKRVPGEPDVGTTVLTLNAHPTCDPVTRQCFVEHPCPATANPVSAEVCFSRIVPPPKGHANLKLVELSRANMTKPHLLQHSHSPCITPNFLVAKLDSFQPGNPVGTGGLLRIAHQLENNEWLVMDRRTNTSRLMKSDFSFVNNHFWNCVEDQEGNVVVQSVTATENYLLNYYKSNLQQPSTNWTKLFFAPQQCVVPPTGDAIVCKPFVQDQQLIFDYPTFNPLFKTNPASQFFYAISPSRTTATSDRWFTRIIKMSSQTGALVTEWQSPGCFVSEADFVPRSLEPGAAEDDGVLLSVLYNATADTSSLLILDAATLAFVDSYPLPYVFPFHAHGIHCQPDGSQSDSGNRCFPNP